MTRKTLSAIARWCLVALLLALPFASPAQEAVIHKALAERLPEFKGIDEISKTPMPGLFEVRIGSEVFYTDAGGNYLIRGVLFDTRTRRNLTRERIDKLTAVDFKDLPFKNAFTIVRGNGKRKMAAFEDPNCSFCKRFEKDFQKVDNVTLHVFLIPILGDDSLAKSRQIWCSADKAKAWLDWMVRDLAPKGKAGCNTAALDANLAFAQKHHIDSTPTLVFADGQRIPGAIDVAQIEQLLGK